MRFLMHMVGSEQGVRRVFHPFLMALVMGLAMATSALAWPTSSQWIAVPKGGDPIQDPNGDAQGSRNVVPDNGSLSAAYVYNDGVSIYFRFRLDADPSGQGGQGLLQPYGWGFEIDTDQNAADYEWLMMCDGITSPEIVALRENTERSELGDPSDIAERIVAQYPLAGNYQITAADTCFDNQNNPTGGCNAQFDYRDYFLDYKIPYSVFKAATGITDTTLIRFFVGSSSAANNLSENGADLVAGSDLYAMASDYVTPFGTLPPTMSFYDGTVRFVTDLNGAFDRDVALSGAPGETLYLRVDDRDLTDQTNPSETITVVVTSPTGDTERVTLYSTGVQGKYTGSLPTSTSNSTGTLHILSGQTATVTYYDAVTSNRSQNVARTDAIFFTAAGTDLSITKTVDLAAPIEGQTVTFTITATNKGPSAVTAASVSDVLPIGLTYLSHNATLGTYTSGTGIWSISSNLAVGVSATLTLRATVNAGTNGQTLVNTASLTSSTPADGYSANNTASASIKVGGTDLRVTKSVDKPLPLEGDAIVYSVRVINLGPASTSGVQVTDLLPTGVTYASYTASQGTYTAGTGLWDVGTLANGNGALLRITATVNSGTTGDVITNTATLTASDQPDINSANNSANATIKVEYLDLVLTKQVRRYAPTTTSFGDNVAANTANTLEFKVEVKNNGPHGATGIVVTDTVPVGLTYVASSASVTHGSYDSTNGVWTVGGVANGATATLLFRTTVNNGTAGQTLINQARVTAADQSDNNPGDEYDIASVAVNGTDLRITKSVSNSIPNPANSITWTVTIYNDGPNQATNVVASDRLPTGVTRTSHTASPGTWSATGGNPSWVWDVGTINVNASATLTIVTTVDAGTSGQTIVNDAFITGADQADPNDANNVASANIYVSGTDLNITKAVDDNTPNVGQNVVYTLTATNQGPANATSVQVNDLLPPEVSYVSHTASAGTYTPATGIWAIGNLNNAATATLAITATVLNEDQHLTITNTATISAAQADQDPSDNTATVDIYVNATDLALTKVTSNATPYEGFTFNYTVTVVNSGSSQATGVGIEDLLPTGVTYVSHTASQGTFAAGLWTVGSLNGGASATLTITVRADNGTAGNTITNTASLYDLDQIDTDTANDTGSVDVVPQAPVNVTLVKMAHNIGSSGYDIPGEVIRYTLTVLNADSRVIDSNSIELTDPIPANTALLAIDPVVTVSNNPATTGLTLTYGGLADGTDQVEFSTDGSDFSYLPSNLVNGTDPNVTHIRYRPSGSMSGSGASFTVTFKVKIK